MTLAGIVARPHSVSGFANLADIYSRAGIAAGGVFSAFAAVRIQSIVAPVNDQQIAGNLDVAGGWAICRAGGYPCAFKFSVFGLDLVVPVEPSCALDRTFLLGIEADGTNVHALVDGVVVASALAAAPVGTAQFDLGGCSLGLRDATTDAVVCVGYDGTTPLTPSGWAALWAFLRKNARPNPASHEFVWSALILNPSDATLVGPTTWVNSGTAGVAGDLTFGGTANLTFVDDPNPSWQGVIAPAASSAPLLNPLDIYVAPVGLDSNDGLTPATPVLTMAGAYSKIPTHILGAPVRIHTAEFQGPFLEWTPIPDFVAHNDQGQILIFGDGAGQAGEDGFLEAVTGAAAGAATTNVSVDFAGTPDAFTGFFIVFSNGPAAGELRTIRNNTATEIIPTAAFTATPNPGDLFDIKLPATFVDASAVDLDMCAASGSLFPTVINLAYIGSPTVVMRVTNVPCLKLFGCLFEGQLSVLDSNVYAGATGALGLADNIHLDQLWAALGGVLDAAGWGVSNPAGHINSTNLPLENFTGFLVSLGLLSLSDRTNLRLFGGLVGGVFIDDTAPGAKITFEAFTVPALARTTEQSSVMFLFGTEITVEGDAALLFEGLLDVGALILSGPSVGRWLGDLTLNASGNTATDDVVSLLSGSSLTVTGTFTNNVTNSGGSGCSNLFVAGGECVMLGDANFQGDNNVMMLVGQATTEGVVRCPSPNTFNATGLSPYALAFVGGFLAIGTLNSDNAASLASAAVSGKVVIAFCTVTNCLSGFVSTADSSVNVALFSGTVTGGQIMVSVGGSEALIGTQPGTAFTGAGPAMVCAADSQLTFTGELAYTDLGLLIAGNSSSFMQLTGPGLVGTGPCLSLSTNSRVDFNGDMNSSAATACLVTTGAQLSTEQGSLSSITAGADCVDCTGGGTCAFSDASEITLVAAGFELVVGSGVLEKSSFALALPNPGDSFSNAGAGSTISRHL